MPLSDKGMFLHVNAFYGDALSDVKAFLLSPWDKFLTLYTLDIENFVDFKGWESVMGKIRQRTYRILFRGIQE